MIVAAGARDREPEEGLRDDVDLVVHVAHLLVDRVDRLVAVLDHPEVRGADRGLVQPLLRIGARGGQQVARDMLPDEAVVGHVGVEGANQIVAVAPGLRDGRVAFAAMRVGVADEVHPVAGEVLAVAGRGQQAVDDLGEGLGRGVGLERSDF